MTAIDPDILAVAAVVLGEQRTNLTGWQRDHAIHAMTALGYSRHHIAWSLRTSLGNIKEYCRRRNIHTHTTDQHRDWVAIDMVVTGTARIHLTGPDRAEAIRVMAGHLTADEIAHRLRLPEATDAREIAKRLGVTLLERDRWSWESYMTTGNGVTTRRSVAA